ncbi:hypothetical protein Tco_0517563 [Tanacetum coccineum]
MGDVHLNTQKDSREFSVKYPIPTPRELDVIPDEYYDENYQKRFDELVKDFLSPTSIYDNISIGDLGDIESKEIDTPNYTRHFPYKGKSPLDDTLSMVWMMQINTTLQRSQYEIKKSSVEILNPFTKRSKTKNDYAKECEISIKGNAMESKVKSFENEIISLEKDAFQNEVISNQEKINDTCETEEDLKFFDDLLNEDPLFPDVFNVENDFQDYKEEINISCDMIPPGIDTDDDSEGDVPPFEEPLDDGLFPLPKVDILPIKVEPVEASAKVKTVNVEVQLQALVDGKKIIVTEASVRHNVVDEALNEELDDSLVRAATTATGLDAEQDSGNIDKTQSKATPNEPSSQGTSLGGGPRRQDTMGDTIA